MSYIGLQPATNFETVRKQVSTTNSGTTITLDYSVSSVQDILVTVNAVVQSYDNYSVSGTTLTLGGTLNNDRVEILFVGRTFQTVTPAVGTVTNDMLSGSIANSKLANSSITLNGSAVSLGGSATVDNTPNWNAYLSSNQTLSNNTTTLVTFNAELFDSDSAYDTSNGKFTVPSGQGGKYYFGAMCYMNINDTNKLDIELYVNNSAVALSRVRTGKNGTVAINVHTIRDLSVGDYVTVKAGHDYGSDRDLVSGSSISGFWGCKLA